jgi:hypothetical protein
LNDEGFPAWLFLVVEIVENVVYRAAVPSSKETDIGADPILSGSRLRFFSGAPITILVRIVQGWILSEILERVWSRLVLCTALGSYAIRVQSTTPNAAISQARNIALISRL